MRQDILIVDESFEGIPEELMVGCLLAKDGLYVFQRLHLGTRPFIDVVSKLGPGYQAEGMKPYHGGLTLHVPPISREQLLEVEAFFQRVHSEYHSEAIVFLYFSPAQGGKWRFAAIEQEVSPGHLKWTSPGAAPRGWFLAGSFHSHGTMSAFHSGTDNADELGWDGIYVTIGKVTSPRPEYVASVVIGGSRFKVGIEDLIEPAPETTFPEEWMALVRRYVPPQPVVLGGQLTGLGRYISREYHDDGGEE